MVMPSESTTVNSEKDQEIPEGITIVKKNDKDVYRCLHCKKIIPSIKNLNAHVKGKKHKLKSKKQKKKSTKKEESKELLEKPSNSSEEMYSERYPHTPYPRRSWNPGFQQNHREHYHPRRNWTSPANTSRHCDSNYPNYYNHEDRGYRSSNHRNNYSSNHRTYRSWPEMPNVARNYNEPEQSMNQYQRSWDEQNGTDSNIVPARPNSEGAEANFENNLDGEKDSNASKRSEHESYKGCNSNEKESSNVSCKSTSENDLSQEQNKGVEIQNHFRKESDTSSKHSHNELNKSKVKNLSVGHQSSIDNRGKRCESVNQKNADGSKASPKKKVSSKSSSSCKVPDLPINQRRQSNENVTDRLVQLINPSNPKAKAEVLKLVTQFSKSKKKENLVKLKQQTDADSWNKEKCPYTKKKQKSPSNPSETPNQIKDSSQRTESNHITVQEVSNINPFGVKERKRRSNSENSEPRVRKSRKRTSDIHPHERVLLRELEEERMKNGCPSKHKCSSAECLESCVNERSGASKSTASTSTPEPRKKKPAKSLQKSIREVYDPANVALKTLNVSSRSINEKAGSKTMNELSNSSINVSINSENILPRPVKQEVEAPNVHPCLLEAFTLEEAINEQQTKNLNNTNSALPVESLIELFASGNVKVKKEFDDPFIDMIRTVDPVILNQACETHFTTTSQSGHENDNASLPQADLQIPEDTSEADDGNYPILKASFKNILNEMENISTLEEKVKTDLQSTELKLQDYQALVDQWKAKKIKLQTEEENLRKQRNSLVRTMADLVAQSNFEKSEQLSKPTDPLVPSSASAGSNENNSSLAPSKPGPSSTVLVENSSVGCHSNSLVDDGEEIAILPVPDKSSSIPVIDLEDSDSEESQPTGGTEKSSISDILSEHFSGTDSFPTHGATVNSLQVFEDCLYTCSNDSTARRFPLNKNSSMVVYHHQKRNVSQLCVEKVRGLTLVFTICTGSKCVTAFKAKDGTPFRTYNLNFSVASLCKSKGLIYAGLRNGSIVVCNWKDHKELVNISEPIRSIDTTQQGRLNILVTLSVHGNVSIRDAERNGLLIRYVKARSYLPLFMTVCSDCVYLSSAGVMTVLNIESGTFSSKYSFAAAYTCLAVYRDSIFTASFSGLVRCYPKDEERVVKMYYGAGNTAVTCIHVHNGWVFTGNRFGAISVFKHDPDAAHPCKVGKCDFLFPRLDDLKTHVLQGKYHPLPNPGSLCSWRKCSFVFPLSWEPEYIKIHYSEHLCNQA